MKKLLLLLISVILVFLSGCITIFEEYKINSDGSGSMEYLVDMSELQKMMEIFSDSLDISELNLSGSFTSAVPDLNIMKGIHNAELAGIAESFVFGIRFDFDDMESLNRALGLLFEDNENSTTRFVGMKRRKFTRYDATSDDFSHKSMMKEGLDIDESVMKDILDRMQYKISMSFEKEIRKVRSSAGYQQKTDNSIIMKANFNQLLDEPDYLKTVVKTR
jgi:hypothetical protein